MATGRKSQLADASAQQRVDRLEKRVRALEDEVQRLKDSAPEPETVVLRTISREAAKQEIRELFQSGGTWYYSDIARRLRLDLELVVDICSELIEEGEIGHTATPEAISRAHGR